ncbi:MAG: YeaC family protein [Parahaliea sp.]
MNYRQLIDSMTPEVYEKLKRAVELGKWSDGQHLSAEQRQQCLQAIIVWGETHLPEQERIGYIADSCKSTSTASGKADIGNNSAPRHWPE